MLNQLEADSDEKKNGIMSADTMENIMEFRVLYACVCVCVVSILMRMSSEIV